MEDSQKAKNDIVYNAILGPCERHRHQLFNYGLYNRPNDNNIKYYQLGIIASILLEAKAVDFIITGCGTGQGALMSLNAFSNIFCGYVSQPLDAFLFSQVNAGNAISLAFAQNFGWGSELTITDIVEKLFSQQFGDGYPLEYQAAQAISRKAFVDMKKKMFPSVIEQLKGIDVSVIKKIIDYKEFKEMFYANAQNQEMIDFVTSVLNS